MGVDETKSVFQNHHLGAWTQENMVMERRFHIQL